MSAADAEETAASAAKAAIANTLSAEARIDGPIRKLGSNFDPMLARNRITEPSLRTRSALCTRMLHKQRSATGRRTPGTVGTAPGIIHWIYDQKYDSAN